MSAGAVFSHRRRLYAPGIDGLCVTGAGGPLFAEARRAFGGPIDAPLFIPAGACRNLSPFWFHGDSEPQMVVARGEWK